MILKVSAIKEGTVIDHIPAEAVFKVADILKLDSEEGVISVATNLSSKLVGKKGIIKVGGKYLTPEEVSKIALVAPNATINLIKDFNVKKKDTIKLPEEFINVIKCSNPKCITNAERAKSVFRVECKNPLKVRCHYCERVMNQDNISLI